MAKRCNRAYIGRFTDQDGSVHRVHAERQGDKIEGYRWQVLGDGQDAECSGKTFGEAVKAACDAWPEIELGEVAGDALRRYLAWPGGRVPAPRVWWPTEAEKLGRMLGADKECPVAEFIRCNREADVAGYEQECKVGEPTAICGLCAEMLGHRETSADGLCAIRLRMLVPVLLPDDVEEQEG